MKDRGIRCETVKLVEHDILPGTCSDMGEGDEWPRILEKILATEMLLLESARRAAPPPPANPLLAARPATPRRHPSE